MHPAITSESLKRPREEEIFPKENLLKKQKLEISACFGRLSSISGLSKKQFSEEILSQLNTVSSLFQTLQEAATSSSETCKDIQKSRFDIKIIQKRLSEAEHTDETEKKELLQRIDTLLISLKSSENQHKPTSSVTINLPPKLLSLLPLEKSCLHWLWESNHVSIKIPEVEKTLKGHLNEVLTRSQLMSAASFVLKADIKNLKKSPEVIELSFSKELEKIVDDTLLVMILNEVTALSDWLQVINHFDFSCCPNLSIETPKILLASCPNLRPDSFQPLASQRFHDHTLLVEGEEIHVNKKFISHFSPYFKALFESGFKEGVDVKNGTPITILSDCTYQSTKDCIDALIGVYNPAEEKNLDRAIAFLLEADKLNIASFLKIGESTIVAILDSLSSHRITEEALCLVNKEFYLHFANKRFLFLFKKLSELAKPIYENLWQQFYGKLPPLSEEKREEELTFVLSEIITFFDLMYEKKFPCGTEAKVFTLLEKIAEEYAYSKTYAPLVLRLFEVVNALNPCLEEIEMMMAGHYYWASFNSDERNYEKAKKIIEETLLLWPNSKSIIPLRICLSELLRVGGSDTPPNLFEARKVLEEGVEKFPGQPQVFKIFLVNQILAAGSDSQKSLREAYVQLIPFIEAKKKNLNLEKVIIYFKFLVASMGIEGLSIPPDSEEIRKIVAAVYQEKHFLETAINDFLSAVRIKTTDNHLYGLQLSPYYQIALQAIKMLPEEKQAKIFES